MPTAYHMLRTLRSLGLHFSLSEDRLAVRPRDAISADIRAGITAHRNDLVQIIEAESQPPCIHDVFERAAILEFDGGHTRTDADHLARAEFGLSSWDGLASPSPGGAEK